MTIEQIERIEKKLFSFNAYVNEKTEWEKWAVARELYTLEDLLEPWRIRC